MMHMSLDISKAPKFEEFAKVISAKRKDFYAAAMEAVVNDILKGIRERIDITGGRFPQLSPVTIAIKGHDQPLVFRGLLSNKYTYEMVNQWRLDRGEITVKPLTAADEKYKRGSPRDKPRDQVAKELQLDGIPSAQGRKFFYFFGISQDAAAEITDLIDQVVMEALRQI